MNGIDLTAEAVHLFLTGVVGLCSLVIAGCGYYFRTVARDLKELSCKVEEQGKAIAILLDRDRRVRINDYKTEDSYRHRD